jgi:hypothetical protein
MFGSDSPWFAPCCSCYCNRSVVPEKYLKMVWHGATDASAVVCRLIRAGRVNRETRCRTFNVPGTDESAERLADASVAPDRARCCFPPPFVPQEQLNGCILFIPPNHDRGWR